MSVTPETVLLEINNLTTRFSVRSAGLGRESGTFAAVDDVSLTLRRGHTLGLLGESGCGKTTLARTILRLTAPTDGGIRFENNDWLALTGHDLRSARRRVQMVFQDPAGSFNPRHTIARIIAEPLMTHRLAARRSADQRVVDLLDRVGLPATAARCYPHELSGGQRQRVGIARALAPQPDLIVLDEPVSALDVSIQGQIINLLRDLQRDIGVAYIFIAHDPAVVRQLSQDVIVMFQGRIVEHGPVDAIFDQPSHPYTRQLLRAAAMSTAQPPAAAPARTETARTPSTLADACAFLPRCEFGMECCRAERPALAVAPTGDPNHVVACVRAIDIQTTTAP